MLIQHNPNEGLKHSGPKWISAAGTSAHSAQPERGIETHLLDWLTLAQEVLIQHNPNEGLKLCLVD